MYSNLVTITEQKLITKPMQARMSSVDKKRFFFNDKYQFAEDRVLDLVQNEINSRLNQDHLQSMRSLKKL